MFKKFEMLEDVAEFLSTFRDEKAPNILKDRVIGITDGPNGIVVWYWGWGVME